MQPLWWLGWVVFVVYGSLLPFEFVPLPLAQALQRFAHLPYLQLGIESRADWVANGVLYLPVGGLTAHLLLSRWGDRRQALAVLLAIGFGLFLATAVEFAQEFFPGRTVSQNDLIAEAIGSLLGALAVPPALPLLRRLEQGWQMGGPVLAYRALVAYALAYLGLSFFPYDLLLNAGEWQAKLASELCGWWLAPASRERGWIGLLLLVVEAVLSLPFGLLLAWPQGAGSGLARSTTGLPPGPPGPLSLRAFACGLLLGLVIEGGQLAIASGVSQGASLLSRGLGVALGAWCAGHGLAFAATVQRRLLRQPLWAAALWLAYSLLLLAASGWLSHGLRSAPEVAKQWAALRLMPFYYHYFTTEAQALFSLGSVALMYAPLAVLGFVLRRPLRVDLAWVAALALLTECGKLWFDGLHPDPSNLLIALASCAVVRQVLLRGSQTPPSLSPPAQAAVATPARPAPPAAMANTGLRAIPAVAALLVVAALVQAWTFPAWPLALTGLIAAAALAVAWRPAWVLLLLPAAMPVLDWAPLSGRLLWDEFDLLQLAVLAIVWLRTAGQPRSAAAPLSLALKLVLALWWLSLGLSLAIGGMPWPWPDADSQLSLHQPYNALRIAKGALWAGALILTMRRLPESAGRQQRLLGAGLCLGLALALAVVVWERWAFAGLLDFAADYRVTGPFSAMHTGGATIECFLAMAAGVALAALLQARRLWPRLGLMALLALASYAVAVTYSRGGYAALALASLTVLGLHALGQRPQRSALAWSLGLLLMAASAAPVLWGSFAQQRLGRSGQDLEVRQAHWHDAMAIRGDPSVWTSVVGAGLGRYPTLHYWQSAETEHAGMFSRVQDLGVAAPAPPTWLRLGAGTAVYIEQLVDVRPGQPLQLSLELRSPPGARLGVALCEKWMLSSAQCATVTPLPDGRSGAPASSASSAPAAAHWRKQHWRLDTQDWVVPPAPRPVKLALFHADGAGAIEVSQVRLQDADGQPLLRNGDFAQGFDHWYFSTDIDPPWHIHNWPLTVLLEQGWLGVLAWSAMFIAALHGAVTRARRGDGHAAGMAGALLAFLGCALLNTLTDTPRLLWLLAMLLWLAAAGQDRQDDELRAEAGPGSRNGGVQKSRRRPLLYPV